MKVATGVPVKIEFNYHLANLFDRHGNSDGDDYVLKGIAEKIIYYVERRTGYTLVTSPTIHNDLAIVEIRDENGNVVWENKWYGEDLFCEEKFKELWESLPEPVKQALTEIAEKGIDL